MNADRLFALYDRVADAPDAVGRLRRFVLDLAVRGKLVEQDPADEPASELLERISDERKTLLRAKRIKRVVVDPVALGETPFRVPSTWQWTRLGNVGDWGAGSTPSRANTDFFGGDVTWLKSGELDDNRHLVGSEETITQLALDSCSFRMNRPGDVLIAMYGATIGKLAILAESAVTNQAVCGCTPFQGLLSDFFFLFLLSQRRTFRRSSEGGAQPNISKVKIVAVPFPLPPFAEQHRIVAKVDELMTLCDRLEEARTAREDTRDRLTKASLARLSAADTDVPTFRSHARFAVDALPALTARADQVKHLRQTVLNLAVRGKLVEQDPADEPASELLRRIEEEGERLARHKKTKKRRVLPPIDPECLPFDLPKGWSWATFPELGLFGRGKSRHRPRNDPILFVDGTYPMVQTGDVARSNGVISTYTSKYNETGLAQSMLWPKGTLCITIAANIADSGILSFDACFPDSVVGLIPYPIFQNSRYFEYFMRTAKDDLFEFAPSTAQKNINLGILETLLISLPPLAEQHRIVAKVDELMALCDRIEAGLAASDGTRSRLLESLLHDALRTFSAS